MKAFHSIVISNFPLWNLLMLKITIAHFKLLPGISFYNFLDLICNSLKSYKSLNRVLNIPICICNTKTILGCGDMANSPPKVIDSFFHFSASFVARSGHVTNLLPIQYKQNLSEKFALHLPTGNFWLGPSLSFRL